MTETIPELEVKLAEAKLARHKILTGTQEVSVSLDSYGSTTYNQSNISLLENYINSLQQEIAKANGSPRRAIIRVGF